MLGADSVLPGDTREYLSDYSETHNLRGRADAVAVPKDADAVAATVRWCDAHDVPMIPRGGGTGLAGGAVPLDGGVVISLERLTGPVQLDAELWRAHVPAGVRTGDLQRRARESGLLYAPDPGALEQSQIGGNINTNAGGPHAFKYGVTGTWVRGLELVLASGEQIRIGGPVRKDVAGYDLKSLIVGSEGTLAIVTAAWLRLVPAPDVVLPVVAFYPDVETGCAALATVMGSGLQPAALEYLDEPCVGASLGAFPADAPDRARLHAPRRGRWIGAGSRATAAGAAGGDGPGRADHLCARGARRDPRAVALARRGGPGRDHGPRRQDLRGHRRPDGPPRRGDPGHARDRPAPRPAGVQLGSRGRRQPALDVHGRSRGRGRGRARGGGRPGALRARRLTGWLGVRRARARSGQARRAGAPVARRGARSARVDQAPVRPQGPAQPGEEAGAAHGA